MIIPDLVDWALITADLCEEIGNVDDAEILREWVKEQTTDKGVK